jgi:hypothetical protein
MARLPTPNGDGGQWGTILNDFLNQAHQSDGLLKPSSVTLGMIATNTVVDLSNDQTVNGVKTFTDSPIVPTPTTDTQVANKIYVDGITSSFAVVPGNTTGATDAVAIDSVTGTTGVTVASDDGAIAIGYDGTNAASATGTSSVAIGADSVAAGNFAVALGSTANVTGDSSTAIGWGAEADGEGAVALGGGTYSEAGSQGASAIGDNSLAVGTSSANGVQSIAIGSAAATGYETTAIGFNTIATVDQSTAMGSGSSVYASGSIAVGLSCSVDSSSYGTAMLGYNSNAYNSSSSLGVNGTLSSASDSISIGGNVYNAQYSTALNGYVNGGGGSANGAVAIGQDSNGIQAEANSDNQFILGTSNHNVDIPGSLEVAGNLQVDNEITLPSSSPNSPSDGKIWIASDGLYFQANGTVYGPITA